MKNIDFKKVRQLFRLLWVEDKKNILTCASLSGFICVLIAFFFNTTSIRTVFYTSASLLCLFSFFVPVRRMFFHTNLAANQPLHLLLPASPADKYLSLWAVTGVWGLLNFAIGFPAAFLLLALLGVTSYGLTLAACWQLYLTVFHAAWLFVIPLLSVAAAMFFLLWQQHTRFKIALLLLCVLLFVGAPVLLYHLHGTLSVPAFHHLVQGFYLLASVLTLALWYTGYHFFKQIQFLTHPNRR